MLLAGWFHENFEYYQEPKLALALVLAPALARCLPAYLSLEVPKLMQIDGVYEQVTFSHHCSMPKWGMPF